jgi:hypothetical protein
MHQSPNLHPAQAALRRLRYPGWVGVARLTQGICLSAGIALVAVVLPGCSYEHSPDKTHSGQQVGSVKGAGPGPLSGGLVDLGNEVSTPWGRGGVDLSPSVSPQGQSVTDHAAHKKSENGEQGVGDSAPYCLLSLCVDHELGSALARALLSLLVGVGVGYLIFLQPRRD